MLRQVVLLLVVYAVSAQLVQKQKLRFKLSARGLSDKDDGLGTSDPYVEIYSSENGGKETMLGRTATISNSENPDWGDVFEFDFDRTKGQRLHFKVYDEDDYREDDGLGRTSVAADDFVDKGFQYTADLGKKGATLLIKNADTVQQAVPQVLQVQQPQQVLVQQPVAPVVVPQQPQYVQVQPAVQPHQVVVQQPVQPQQVLVQQPIQQARRIKFQVSARGLPDTDVLGTVDPYVKVFYTDKVRSSESLLGRTAPIQDEENPNWKEVLEFDYVPGNAAKWRFVLLDKDNNRQDDEVGSATLDVDQYVASGENSVLNLSKGQLFVKKA